MTASKPPMVMTTLEARVAPEHEGALIAAFEATSAGPFPPGFVSSHLARSASDPQVFQMTTLWESAEALATMRAKGTPRGVVIFREAFAEPTLTIREVVRQMAAPRA